MSISLATASSRRNNMACSACKTFLSWAGGIFHESSENGSQWRSRVTGWGGGPMHVEGEPATGTASRPIFVTKKFRSDPYLDAPCPSPTILPYFSKNSKVLYLTLHSFLIVCVFGGASWMFSLHVPWSAMCYVIRTRVWAARDPFYGEWRTYLSASSFSSAVSMPVRWYLLSSVVVHSRLTQQQSDFFLKWVLSLGHEFFNWPRLAVQGSVCVLIGGQRIRSNFIRQEHKEGPICPMLHNYLPVVANLYSKKFPIDGNDGESISDCFHGFLTEASPTVEMNFCLFFFAKRPNNWSFMSSRPFVSACLFFIRRTDLNVVPLNPAV